MTDNDALCRFIDRDTVEYVRTYPHPIERVWNAITDPAQMSIWFGPIQFEPRLGERDALDQRYRAHMLATQP